MMDFNHPSFRISRIIYLQLSPGEPTTGPNTAVVLDGRASHNGTQLVNRTGSNSGSLSETGVTSAVLATGLFENQLVHQSKQ